MPRPAIYTEDEKKARQQERNRNYQRKRYAEDKDFRQKRIDHSIKTNFENRNKLKQKLDRLEELEKLLNETIA